MATGDRLIVGWWRINGSVGSRAVLGVVIAWVLGVGAGAYAGDWPMFRHDSARSGITAEELQMPLSQCWVFQPRHAPEPAKGDPSPRPVGGWYGLVELRRAHFDDAFHVAVVGDAVYFGSSADGKVYSLDAATGKVRWSMFTGGPVRLAPTVWNGCVYVGSDDGFVYCLRADNGEVVWKFRAAPSDQKLLGSGKMISLWPVRTGVLVDGGIAYFGAGIFPAEGVYMYAVRARDGELIWCNDTCAAAPQSRISPQGYLLASKTALFAPMGRVPPASFNRKDGRLLHQTWFTHHIGGTYALLADDHVFTGTEEIMAYNQKSRAKFAWFAGRQLIVTRDVSYTVSEKEMVARSRKTYAKASVRRFALRDQRPRLSREVQVTKREHDKLTADIKLDRDKLTPLDKQMAALDDEGNKAEIAALKAERNAVEETMKANTEKLAAVSTKLVDVEARHETMEEEWNQAGSTMTSSVLWRLPCKCPDSMILAGSVLFAGGKGQVVAVNAATGKKLWTGEVDGKAKGLAVSDGQLFVSTDTGAIYCFGSAGPPQFASIRRPARPVAYPRDKLTPIYEAAANAIVEKTGVDKGYCLVLGCGTGRLAFELAKRTELMIYGLEPDHKKVERARKALDAAGVYGVRVCIDQGSLSTVPYSDYFANLVVSEQVLLSGLPRSGRARGFWARLFDKRPIEPPSAKELFRVLKPLGGVACIGQPGEATNLVEPLTPEEVKKWLEAGGVSDYQVSEGSGVWVTATRGALPGAGCWTHQYANAANTTCSDDQLVKCPLGLLWFGKPGPHTMAERHRRAAVPLAINGRFFVQGEGYASRIGVGKNVVMAYDAYNGLKLWERSIRGALRTGVSSQPSSMAANADSLFVVAGAECFRLDAATGRTEATYKAPAATDGKPRRWGYVACVGELLYGSRTSGRSSCDCIFAIDITTGRLRWTHAVRNVPETAIAIGDGRLMFADMDVTQEERQAALQDKTAELERLKGTERAEAEKKLNAATVRLVGALDARSGNMLWQKPIDLTGCGGGAYYMALANIYKDGVLVFFGVYNDGHYWRQFFAGQFGSRRVVALSAKDGNLLWTKKIGYRVRPLVVGDTFHAEPWAFDLRTGEQRTRAHPVTGREEVWQFARPGHHCGCPAASPHTMLFRSSCLGYYDLVGDYGTMHFGAQRPGCWINFIPANGLLIMPEASSGCMCAFPNMCTAVFKHRKQNRAWAYFSSPGPMTPVKRLALNFGAPGDRKDDAGTLWFGYPRPGGSLVLRFKVGTSLLPGGGYFRHDPARLQVQGSDKAWVFRSGARGLTQCTVPVIGKGQEPGAYTVRLSFVELDNDRPGQRVFDVKLQGEVVLENFDIFRAAGGRNKAVVREFKDVDVRSDLRIEFVPKPKESTLQQAPVISGVEVFRTEKRGAKVPVGEFKEPMETYNLGYWYADFVRQQADADIALVPREALWGEAESYGAGPVTLGQLFGRFEDSRIIKSTVEGKELIRYLSAPEVAERLNPYCPGASPGGCNALYYSGLKVSYDVTTAKPSFDLSPGETYAVASIWPFGDRGVYGREKPPIEDARKAAPIMGLGVTSKIVLDRTTWNLLEHESKTRKLEFAKRYPEPAVEWTPWKKQIVIAMEAREKARFAEMAKRFAKEIVLAGGITWQLVAFDDFERAGLGPNWKVLQGKWTIREGKVCCASTSFLGCAKKIKTPVRIEFDARSKTPGDLSPFLGTESGAYKSGYFIGFGSNANTCNKILKLEQEVAVDHNGPLIVPNRWHHVIGQVLRGKVQLIVDGKLALEYVDPSPVKDADMAGVISWNDAELDNIRIYTGQ